jgi:hypothetical protein
MEDLKIGKVGFEPTVICYAKQMRFTKLRHLPDIPIIFCARGIVGLEPTK